MLRLPQPCGITQRQTVQGWESTRQARGARAGLQRSALHCNCCTSAQSCEPNSWPVRPQRSGRGPPPRVMLFEMYPRNVAGRGSGWGMLPASPNWPMALRAQSIASRPLPSGRSKGSRPHGVGRLAGGNPWQGGITHQGRALVRDNLAWASPARPVTARPQGPCFPGFRFDEHPGPLETRR